jgi:hypothetical protein
MVHTPEEREEEVTGGRGVNFPKREGLKGPSRTFLHFLV